MAKTIIKAKKEDMDWYNKFYIREQVGLTSWYSFMLPELIKEIKKDSKILELGCGQSKGLRYLVENNYIYPSNAYGIDQSEEAVNFSKNKLPKSNFSQGDIYNLKFEPNKFDYIFLMEVIEHLENPSQALEEVSRILKPGGKLVLSFPNYINFPWLIVRILSEKLNKPNWIVLQPVDKIYGVNTIVNLCKKKGLKYEKCIGSNYFPPLLWKYEKKEITAFLNILGVSFFSFHPILFFKK